MNARRWVAVTATSVMLAACGPQTPPTPTPTPAPALPAAFLAHVEEVTADLNAYWAASELAGDGYESPTVRPHRAGELPASVCAEGTDPNEWRQTAFYCFDDRTLTYDADFLAELYAEGPGVATTVLAHEWGHHVQGLTVIPERSLQRELQADCFAGAYLAPTAEEPNDISVAEASLRRLVEAGNEEYRQSAWFDIAEHGSPGLRWVSFIIGVLTFSDPSICEGHATYQPRPPEQLGGFVVAHIPGTDYETDADGISITYGDVHLRLAQIEPDAMPPADGSSASQLTGVFETYAGPMVVHDFTVGEFEEDRAQFGHWLGASYVAETPGEPESVRLGMARLFRAANGEGLFVDSYSDEPAANLSGSVLEEAVDDTLTLAYAIENFVCLPGQSSERGSPSYYFACDIEVPE